MQDHFKHGAKCVNRDECANIILALNHYFIAVQHCEHSDFLFLNGSYKDVLCLRSLSLRATSDILARLQI